MGLIKLRDVLWIIIVFSFAIFSAILISVGETRAGSYDYPVWEVSPDPQLQLPEPTGPSRLCAGMDEPVQFSLPHDADKDTWVYWDKDGNKHGAVYYEGKYKITWTVDGNQPEGFDLNYKIPGSDDLPGKPNYGRQITASYLAQDIGTLDDYHSGFDKVGCDKDEDVRASFSFFVWNDVRLKKDFANDWKPIQEKHNSYRKEFARKRVTVLGIPFGGEISFAAAQKVYTVERNEIEGLVASLNSSGEEMTDFAEKHMGANIPEALVWSVITGAADPTPITGMLNAVIGELEDEVVKQRVMTFIGQVQAYANRWSQINLSDKAKAIGGAEEINVKLSGWKDKINEALGKLEGEIISVIQACPCTSWPMEGYYEIIFPE